MTVLIIDDDAALSANLATGLRRAGLSADVVVDPRHADCISAALNADAVVLDVMLGEADGLDLCRQMRRAGVGTPILMLTAREAIADRVRGLEAGADDYLVKPFALEELVARIRALMRRGVRERAAVLEVGDLRFDTRDRHAEVRGQVLPLTEREAMLLERLLHSLDRPVSQERLQEQLWGDEASPGSNLTEVYVSRLRRKLAAARSDLSILTLKRRGYQLTIDAAVEV
jgi:DNA-binding response OmpR family regulator